VSERFCVECLDCGHRTDFHPFESKCPQCNSGWRVARYDENPAFGNTFLKTIQDRPFNLWRYLELLPLPQPADCSMSEGGTPLLHAKNLGMMLGLKNLYIKDERQNPTSSFKDRQAVVTISSLKEAGVDEAVLASTGNVAISYSAYSSRAGIKLWAFLTSLVPAEKMREVAIYGTQVIKVTASYDQTKQVANQFARQQTSGVYLERGTRSIPTLESMKTLAFEIGEQLGQVFPAHSSAPPWRTPDWYIQSLSGGVGAVGVMKGFRELRNMGLVADVPKIAGVQTAGCAPMAQAWSEDKDIADPVLTPHTKIATLATGDPGRTYTLLRQWMLEERGGTFQSVTDEEAFRAMHVLAEMEGMSMEPASAVAFAGLVKMVRAGKIRPDEVVVVNCTGHTLPTEKMILDEEWAKDVVLPPHPSPAETEKIPEDGILSALSRVTPDKYSHIAIVDDHTHARRLIRRILQSQGEYTFYDAQNGTEALEIAREKQPDLMILDLMMPEQDGFSVIDQLRAQPETASIPIIVVTAKALTNQEKKRLKGRIQSLLQKGEFMNDDLLEEVQKLID
jgi:threonine synthase